MELERFRLAKAAEIEALRLAKDTGRLPKPWPSPRLSFGEALQGEGGFPAIIAEYKRASPSRGIICEDLSVEEVAQDYARNKAKALSILTEAQYFHGDLNFLERAFGALSKENFKLPLLRKDFLFDPLQVEATAATPASALLLIVRMFTSWRELYLLRELAESFGLSAVIEVFDERDLSIARASGAKIIQVNARDLETLQVNGQAALDLISKNPPLPHELWILASGLTKTCELRKAKELGFKACLIGTALMQDGLPGQTLARLLNGETLAS
ncbi:MAG: indole-3-glycerol-phosphate synthase [Desulfovibrio sp.]|nr:indole-3-glycerol-phosphate synthase [Desulfovibrio sp.]